MQTEKGIIEASCNTNQRGPKSQPAKLLSQSGAPSYLRMARSFEFDLPHTLWLFASSCYSPYTMHYRIPSLNAGTLEVVSHCRGWLKKPLTDAADGWVS